MRITHVVVTDAFAGTERYVCEVARRQADRGHDVVVLGGDRSRMPDGLGQARWHAAGSVPQACARLATGGRRDVVHTHLTYAELSAVLTRPAHRATVVATRHIAAPRGKTRQGALVAPLVARRVDVEVAISDFVAAAMERPPQIVLHDGVASVDAPYDRDSRTVLVLQRLDIEKDTSTALHAWRCSGLGEDGWELHVAGDGAERQELERLSNDLALVGVRFLGHITDVPTALSRAALLLAPARREPLGLSVLEAMAHGVPVVAAAGGGHLETLPPGWPYLFPPGDAEAAGQALVGLSRPATRVEASASVRSRQQAGFDVEQHVDALQRVYESSPASRRGPRP